MNTFFGLEIGKRALQTNQLSLDVTGQNISNANTPGYSRQVANDVATDPYAVPSAFAPVGALQIGTGVTAESITRIHTDYLDSQYRSSNAVMNYWQQRDSLFSSVQGVLNEPSANGLQNSMDQFFNSLQELSKQPTDASVRSVVVEQAQTMGVQFGQLMNQFETVGSNIGEQTTGAFSEINSITSQIAGLDGQIANAQNTNMQPNDLLDKRDLLVDQLSNIADVQVNNTGGTYTVTLAGQAVVNGNASTNITSATPQTGSLKALQDMNVYVGQMEQNLNGLMTTVSTQVNTVHQKGYGLDGSTGNTFFTTGADSAGNVTLSVDPLLISNPTKIAAATSQGQAGDGSNALAMATLQHQTTMDSNSATFDQHYSAMIASIGVDASGAHSELQTQQALTNQVNDARQSVSGVNLDEEASNMIKFQQSYAAAARFVTTLQTVMDTLLKM